MLHTIYTFEFSSVLYYITYIHFYAYSEQQKTCKAWVRSYVEPWVNVAKVSPDKTVTYFLLNLKASPKNFSHEENDLLCQRIEMKIQWINFN